MPSKKRTTKPTKWFITDARKQKRQVRAARALARRVVWYFGYEDIASFLDGDIALRDQALALLEQPMVGGEEIPTKIWKRIFRNLGATAKGKHVRFGWGMK